MIGLSSKKQIEELKFQNTRLQIKNFIKLIKKHASKRLKSEAFLSKSGGA